jgi:superfamily II DNA or RNA helicase
VSAAEKSAIEQAFQAGKLDIVLGQYAAVSLGLTFTRGNQIIFAEPTFSLEAWIQTLGRIRRRGQTQTCYYRMLIESSSADSACYEALRAKEDFGDLMRKGAIQLLMPPSMAPDMPKAA